MEVTKGCSSVQESPRRSVGTGREKATGAVLFRRAVMVGNAVSLQTGVAQHGASSHGQASDGSVRLGRSATRWLAVRGVLFGLLLAFIAFASPARDEATWYGQKYRGKLMANGHPFDPDALTAASWHFPLGSRLRVSYAGKSVDVVITDRGGKAHAPSVRVLDLSRGAFSRLADCDIGRIEIEVELLQAEKRTQSCVYLDKSCLKTSK